MAAIAKNVVDLVRNPKASKAKVIKGASKNLLIDKKSMVADDKAKANDEKIVENGRKHPITDKRSGFTDGKAKIVVKDKMSVFTSNKAKCVVKSGLAKRVAMTSLERNSGTDSSSMNASVKTSVASTRKIVNEKSIKDLAKNHVADKKSVDTKELVRTDVDRRIAKKEGAMEKNGMNSEERNDFMECDRGSEVTAAKVKIKMG